MITGITKDKHAIADYAYIPLALAAPRLLGFTDNRQASETCYALGTSVLVYTMLTDAKWGLIKLIPYKTHSLLDVASGVVALGSAAAIKKSSTNRKAVNTLMVMGITGLVVGTLSLIGAKKRY